jgi:hypothetical protein
MYIRPEQAKELYKSSLSTIREQLGSHLDFVMKLTEGDDWSFVIKAQALIEASVSHAVLTQLGDQRIRKTVEIIPLAGDSVSKLQLAKDLSLLDAGQRRFVKRLAMLRNRLAHRIDCLDFDFHKYIESLDRDGLRDWQESVVWFCEEPEPTRQWKEIALRQPRSAVLMSCFQLAAVLSVDSHETEMRRAINSASAEATTELLSSLGRL